MTKDIIESGIQRANLTSIPVLLIALGSVSFDLYSLKKIKMQALIIEVITLTYVHYCERRKEKLKFGGISVKRIGLSFFFFLNSYND